MIIALVVAKTASAVAPVAPYPDDFNALFAFTCMKHFHSQDQLPAALSDHGLEKLPSDQAEFFLGGKSGEAWIMVTPSTRYVVALRDNTSCSVFAQRADEDAVRSGFIALVGTAPEPLVSHEEFGNGPNDEHSKTISYSWSRPKDESALLFVLTTSEDEDATAQAMASVAMIDHD